jgi:hypothetical protein
MLLATTGCSNSSNILGDSWPDFLSKKFGGNLLNAHSCGAGNEMNVEKVRFLCEQYPDLLVIQLTEPSRLVWGAKDIYYTDKLTESLQFKDISYYTVNSHNNVDNIAAIYGHQMQDDKFIRENILTTNYNLEIKTIHTMMAMLHIANTYKVRCMFFSWFVDIHSLLKKRNHEIFFKNVPIHPNVTQRYMEKHFKAAPCSHFYPAAHEQYVDDILYPWVQAHV